MPQKKSKPETLTLVGPSLVKQALLHNYNHWWIRNCPSSRKIMLLTHYLISKTWALRLFRVLVIGFYFCVVFLFCILLCFDFPSSDLKFFLTHAQSLAVFLLTNALICYGESATRNTLMLNRHTEGKNPSTLPPCPIAKISYSSQLFAHFSLVPRKVWAPLRINLIFVFSVPRWCTQ